ncbi:MAG: two-component regulator propeller domain-containing protein [Syntrophomonadaceae bacterium]
MTTFFKKYFKYASCFLMMMLIISSMIVLPNPSNGEPDLILPNRDALQEGLAGMVVNCILQDSSGFLWFGTQNGLYRYNGYSLKPFTFHSDNSNQFVSNFITSVAEDNAGDLWIGTLAGGLFKFHPQSGECTGFYHNPDDPSGLNDNAIRAIYREQSGKLWIGLQNRGLDCFDPATGIFTHYENSAESVGTISSNTVSSICQDKSGTLWIGTQGGGLNRFEPHTGQFIRLNIPGESSGRLVENIAALYVDKADVLWIVGEEGSLNRIDTAVDKLLDSKFAGLKDIKVTAVVEDMTGALWVGTYGNGVGILEQETGKYSVRDSDFPSHNPSRNYRVLSLYPDSSGNLWIGTEASGIEKINTYLDFSSYPQNAPVSLVFNDDVVLSVYKDRAGVIWLGTANGGINRFDRENKQVVYYKNVPGDNNSISSNAVTSIFEDSRGSLWFGTVDGTINKLDQASGNFVRYHVNIAANSNGHDNGIMKIHEGRTGILWACSANAGLVGLDRNTGQYIQYVNDPGAIDSISSNHVLSLAEDDNGTLWIGTGDGGLNSFQPSTNSFTRYSMVDVNSDSRTFNYCVKAIVNDGINLWLATDRNLYQFDKASGSFALISDSQQNANILIYGLLKDDQGCIWLSTTNGLLRYNPKNNKLNKYEFSGGLKVNQYIAGACSKSIDGELFFAGTNGFNCFYPDKIRDNTHRPPVVISDIKVFDKSSAISGNGQIFLSYRDDFISFEFAALDYANPTKNQYAYKLEGFDQDWHYSGTRNYASYTNLDAGDYVLRVKAANNDGFWNEEGARIKLSVIPPFWETGWFIILTVFFAAGLVAALMKLRTRAVELRSMELELQVSERTRELNEANELLRQADAAKSGFLSMVSHEIRTPLSAIMGFTELIAGKIEKIILPGIDSTDPKVQKAAQTVSRDLNIVVSEEERLAALVDNLLNISKIESGHIDWESANLHLNEIVERALSITGPLIEKAGLDLYVNIEKDLPEVRGNRDMLTQAIINLLSNAVKFTGKGYIKLDMQNSDGGIRVSIEDTGAGIQPDLLERVFDRFYRVKTIAGENSPGMGLGLYICRDIIEKHGGKIWAESRPGRGSCFCFILPPAQSDSEP